MTFWKNNVVAGMLLAATVGALGACSSEQRPEEMVRSARTYLSKDDPKSAIIELKNALRVQERNAEARFLLGQAYLRTEELPAAEKELRKAVDLGYAKSEVAPWLAVTMLRLGDYAGVIEAAAGANPSTPRGNAMLQAAIGEAKLAAGDRSAAAAAFDAARAADASYAPGFVGTARLKAATGDLDGALADTASAVALPSVSAVPSAAADAWQLRGEVLVAKQQTDAAVSAFRKAIEIRSDYVPAYVALVNTLIAAGRLDEAKTAVDAMRTAGPRYTQTYFYEALVAYHRKDYKTARDAIQVYRGVDPQDNRGTLLAAAIDYQLGNYRNAEGDLKLLVQRFPDQEFARRLLVGTYIGLGKTADAVQAVKPLVAKKADDPNVLKVAGEVYLRNNQPDEASRYFKKAAAIDSGGEAQTGLAISHLMEGDKDRGLSELEAAAANDPSMRADFATIIASLQDRQFDRALTAIDALEHKQPNKALTQNLRGLALLGKNDTRTARVSFERALEIDPNFFAAALNLSRLDVAEGKPKQADKRLDDMLARNPSNVLAARALSELRELQHATPAEIIAPLEKAISAAPADASARLALINYHQRRKDFKRALDVAQQADSAIPNQPAIIEALAVAQQQSGDLNQALRTYSRLVDVAPDKAAALTRVGELQAATKDYPAATESFRKALSLQPDFLNAQRDLVSVYVLQNKVVEAVAYAREVQRQHPKEARGYIFEGDIYAGTKQSNEAVAAYRKGVEQAATGDVALRLHQALVRAGKQADADKFASTWLSAHAGDDTFRLYLADSADARGDYAAALKQYDALLPKHGDNPVLLNNFAFAAGKMKDPRALRYAERANELAPKQPVIMDTLGTLLVESGNVQRGLDLLKSAVQLAPDAPNLRLHLSKALIRAGDKEGARRELESLAKLGNRYPDQAEVTRLIGQL